MAKHGSQRDEITVIMPDEPPQLNSEAAYALLWPGDAASARPRLTRTKLSPRLSPTPRRPANSGGLLAIEK